MAAMEQGQTLLEQEVKRRNDQLSVETAEEGLSCWEADYSLPNSEGKKLSRRRARIWAAMSGGQCLTRDHLAALCRSVGGADEAEIEEDFSDWRVAVTALYAGRLPDEKSELERALQRLKPAHLQLDLATASLLRSDCGRHLALSGNVFLVLEAREGV